MSLKRRVYAQPVPKLPSGLVELMDGLARDVLKHNPQNIYEFCAQHMQTLLQLRDGHAPKSPITLDQKIARAQKIVKDRAEQRRRKYDDSVHSMSYIISNKTEIVTQSNIPSGGADNFKSTINVKDEADINQDKENKEKNAKNEINTDLKDYTTDTEGVLAKEINKENKKNVVEADSSNQEALQCKIRREESEAVVQRVDSVPANNDDTEKETKKSEANIALNQEKVLIGDAKENSMDKVSETIELNVTLSEIKPATELEIKDTPQEDTITKESENDGTSPGNTQSKNDMQIYIDVENNEATKEYIASSYNETENSSASDPTLVNTVEGTTDNNDDVIKNNENIEILQDKSMYFDTSEQNTNGQQLNNEIEIDCIEVNTEKTGEDDKIFAVILSSSVEHDLTQPPPCHNKENGSVLYDPVSSNESTQITEPSDFESATRSKRDKSHALNNSMDLETAAITIQKVFRSFLFKTKTASYDDPTTVDMNLLGENKDKEENGTLNISMKDRRHLGISRMDTVLQTVNEEKSLSLSTEDSSTLSSAATIIQAHVRGFLVRNKCNLNITTSTNSLIDSDAPSIPSLEADSDNRKSKTVLNIHIVPEGGHYVSRDESILTSMDLSLDSSPPSSINLHPLGYDKSERRKQLKREDAIQSVSPPSNNSGKLSDDVDSVKEIVITESNTTPAILATDDRNKDNVTTLVENLEDNIANQEKPGLDVTSDEMDVITPFVPAEDKGFRESDNTSKLMHSGEFHDILVPTEVTRSDTSVVREFQNVLVYFILWNN